MANINMPKGRDLAQEYSKTISAQMGILPNLLAAQSQFAPIQASNQLSNLNSLLLGTPDQSYNSQIYTPSVYQQGGKYKYGKLPQGISGTIQYPNLPDNRPTQSGNSGNGFNAASLFGMPGGGLPGFSGTGSGNSGGGMPGMPGMGGGMPGMPGMPGMGGSGGGFNPMDPFGMFGGGDSGPPRTLVSPSGYRTVTNNVPGQQGLLSLYENFVAPSLERTQEATNSSQRASDIADVGNLGPQAIAAIMASDPKMAGLLDMLTNQAGSELGMGAQMDPSLMRLATQGVRARQQGMLGGTGSAGDYGEALGLSQFGQQLRQQRRANASGVIGLRQQVLGDPFQRVLGRPGAGLTASANTLNQAMGLGGQSGPMSLLNPESSYAGDLHNTNFNALVNQAIGNANNQNALIGAGISAFGSLAGGAMGAI